MMSSLSRIPDEVLSNIFLFEVSRRKWRLVSKKFSQCVPLHIVVHRSLNAKQEARILSMLGHRNCRSLKATDWFVDARSISKRLHISKSLKSVSIHHSGNDSSAIVELAFASLTQDTIESWSFGDFSLDDAGIVALAEVVKKSRRLKNLEFHQCTFGEDGLIVLAEAFATTKSLRTVNIKSCKLCRGGFQELAKGFSNSASIQGINMAFTPLGDEGLQAMGDSLKKSGYLQHVNLDFSNVGGCIDPVISGIVHSKALTHLSLKGNELGDGGAEALAEVLPKSSIEILNLIDNNISHFGALALGAALPTSKRLRELQLGLNRIGSSGTKALAEGMGRAPSLHVVGLTSNTIGPEGVQWVAKALGASSTLTTLDLSHNIFRDGIDDLRVGLKASKSLQNLNVEGCNLCPNSVALMAAEIRGLKSLNLGSCDLKIEGILAVADAVAVSTSLHTLILRNVVISTAGAQALARAVAVSRSLRHLDLQGCGIATEGVQALGQALTGAAKLESLNLVQNDVGGEGAVALAHGIGRAPAFQSLQVRYSSVTPQGSVALVEVMQKSCSFNDLQLAGPELCVGGGVQTSVTVRPTITHCDVEVIKKHPFTCSRCSHKLYDYDPDQHKVLAYCVDRAGIIQQIMTPEEWDRAASIPTPSNITAADVCGQSLTAFMEHRVAGFYHTLCSLIWDGDLCHTQFQWYCDSPDTRREMMTLVYRFGESLVLTNITVSENSHSVPVSFMAGDQTSVLWRCPFCGWECCNGGDWMEPEEFYMWLITEWPALMRDSDYYPVVCDECLNEWVHKHNNADLHEALSHLRHPSASSA